MKMIGNLNRPVLLCLQRKCSFKILSICNTIKQLLLFLNCSFDNVKQINPCENQNVEHVLKLFEVRLNFTYTNNILTLIQKTFQQVYRSYFQ